MTADPKMTIARNIRRELERQSLTPFALVRLTGAPVNTIYRVCRGENEPGAVLLARIAGALDVPCERFISFRKNRKNSA